MLVRYPDTETARRALDDVVKLWRSWGEKKYTEGMIHTFQYQALRYTSCLLKANILCMTLFSHSKDEGEILLKLEEEKIS